jgi:apolipoprotein N-acyltransferase
MTNYHQIKVSKKRKISTCVTPCLAGALGAVGFAPFTFAMAFLISFGWYVAQVVVTDRPRQMRFSFLFLMGFHIAGLYWLAFPLTINISKHGILIPVAVTLIPAYLALQLLLPALIAKKCFEGIYRRALAFTSCFGLTLYFFANHPLGFPWMFPGYIWNSRGTLLQTASLYGIHGLNVVTILMAALLGASYAFYRKKDAKNAQTSAIIAAALLLCMMIFGVWRLSCHKASSTGYRVRIVQCNLFQKEKNDHQLSMQNLKAHLHYSTDSNDGFADSDAKACDFVIWPEAAIPYLYNEKLDYLHEMLKRPLTVGSFLIAGAIREDLRTAKIYNSVVVINHRGENVANYDKRLLVPFGEYIPFRRFVPKIFQSIASGIGDFDVGDGPRSITVNGLNIAMEICYEAVFPRQFDPADGDIDLILNITNDAWFGFTSQPFQHLQIVRVRAVEEGVPLIRATNFGVSAIFDPYGREISRIDINTAGAVEVQIPKKIPSSTIYKKYGDGIFFGMIILLLIIAAV